MQAEHVQTKREIAELLRAAGVRPRKRLGQHFLIDGNLMRRLVASADPGPGDLVLEVGGGTGALTDLLAKRAGEVICVEIDRGFYAILEDRFRDTSSVTLLPGDILESKHRLRPDVASAIQSHGGGTGGCVKLVANLPYQVVTPLVMNVLTDYPQVRRLCYTVQREVGERITAEPNCKAYGPLTIISQALCEIRTLARVPPQAFWPRPAVDSIMIRMDVVESPLTEIEAIHGFTALVRATFDHRRKTLRTALGYVLDAERLDRVCRLFDTRQRPESFSVQEWLGIYRATRRQPH